MTQPLCKYNIIVKTTWRETEVAINTLLIMVNTVTKLYRMSKATLQKRRHMLITGQDWCIFHKNTP
jgi:hypothetical protein